MKRKLHERGLRRRSLALLAVMVGWMLVVSGRMAMLQIVQHEAMLALAERQQQRTIRITPLRGIIYDRLGRELARSVPVESIFAVPAEVTSSRRTALRLARLLQLDSRTVLKKLSQPREFVWIQRKVSPEQADAIKALKLPGIHFVRENKRYYPNGPLAAHVLGYVSIDEVGLDGVELAYDAHLRGEEGYVLVQKDARGRSYGRTQLPVFKGQDLTLTLDAAIQLETEKALRAAVRQSGARSGVAIVMQPKTGDILALANVPTFNPNSFSKTSEDHRRNRALRDIYEPGSVFKIVTYAAALEEHRATPDEMIDCLEGRIVLAGHVIRDHKPFGLLSVREALENSSNVGAIQLALRVGPQRFAEYIRRFGFGERTGIDLPGEARGIVRPVDKWSRISIGSLAMGQEVGVTALQMRAAMATIANDGVWVQPHVVRTIHSRAGDILSETTPARRRVIDARTARTLARMLEGVILRGTGKRAQLNGYTAAGKTGTAQQIDPRTGRYSSTHYVASFAGFAPLNDPQICILVAIHRPRYGQHHGGDIAAPVFKQIAEMALHYLNVPPDRVSTGVELATLTSEFTSEGTSGVSDVPVSHSSNDDSSSDGDQRVRSHPLVLSTAVVPDFTGQGIRAVAHQCARLGLRLQVIGSGRAVRQRPAPGTPITPGLTCRVEFRRAAREE
ncbi:MAG: penicillin-binding protein [Acidobacteria bacterium]|nr:MAG: penicillin-binding protein [Acidobacteriota bacterium]